MDGVEFESVVVELFSAACTLSLNVSQADEPTAVGVARKESFAETIPSSA